MSRRTAVSLLGELSRCHIMRAEGAVLDRARRQRLANDIWRLAQPMLSRGDLAKLDTKTLAEMKRCMAGAAKAMEVSGEEKDATRPN